MKSLSWTSCLLFLSTAVFAGGDGPCPVPDLVSDFVSSKAYHQTSEVVENLMAFEGEKRVLYQTVKGDAKLIQYGHDCQNTVSGSFAVFSDPKVLIPLASLRPRTLPLWFSPSQELSRTSNRFYGVMELPAVLGTHYQVYKVGDAAAVPVASCVTPLIAGLHPSKGGIYPTAYFHSVRRAGSGRSLVGLYRMNLDTCRWDEEGSFEEKVPVKDLDAVLRFPKQDAVMIVTGEGVLWREKGKRSHFDLNPESVTMLAPDLPVVLVKNKANDLQLFFPQRPGVSTLLADAVDFQPDLVSFAPKGSQLFVAGSVQGMDHYGVYELKLKLPLR